MLNIEYFLQKADPRRSGCGTKADARGGVRQKPFVKEKKRHVKNFFRRLFSFTSDVFSFRPGAWERNFGEPLPDREYHCPGAEQQVPRLC
ncbi:unknown [Prevotella sp. CAG:617]|nr:unknown [Prevotella sp. CAG:617]